VYAIDVSRELADKAAGMNEAGNLDLVVSDGCNIDVPPNTVDLAYSNQVLEHLHTDDAADHLRNVSRALVAGGAYFCSTPNRIGGPHDVSKYFDRLAAGFHLKEYTRRELIRQFREGGFSRVMIYLDLRGRRVRFPGRAIVALERCLGVLPFKAARGMARCLPLRIFVNAWVVAVK
jgi:SAM-dependent methyltransferase